MRTKNYKNVILTSLLRRYEKSVLYQRDSKLNINISQKITPSIIPDYFNEEDYTLKQEINDICIILRDRGFIKVHWKPHEEGNIIEKITLNLERLDDVYREVKKSSKHSLESDTIELLEPYRDREGWLGVFVNTMIQTLEQKQSVRKYLNIELPQETENVLLALDAILKQKVEIPKRIFSIRLFKNSKAFDKIAYRVMSIIKRFGGFQDGLDVLAEHNVISNPTFVYLKGCCTFKCGDEVIDLEKLGGEIGLSTTLISKFSLERLNAKRVMTIENLTTFYTYQPENELVIYLGGYHNHIRRELLKKIHEASGDVPFYHWGDIDLGGFRIFNHLKKMTGIPFTPYRMDEETLRKYEHLAGKMEDKDYREYKDNLAKLLDNEEYAVFHGVIRYMLQSGLRLEQEAV